MRKCDLHEQVVFLKIACLLVFEELLELTSTCACRSSSSGGKMDGDGSMFSGDGSARILVSHSLGAGCGGDLGGSYELGSNNLESGGCTGTGGGGGRSGGRGGSSVLSLLRVLGLFLRQELLGTYGGLLGLLRLLRFLMGNLLRELLNPQLTLSAGSGLGDNGLGLCDGLLGRGRGGGG